MVAARARTKRRTEGRLPTTPKRNPPGFRKSRTAQPGGIQDSRLLRSSSWPLCRFAVHVPTPEDQAALLRWIWDVWGGGGKDKARRTASGGPEKPYGHSITIAPIGPPRRPVLPIKPTMAEGPSFRRGSGESVGGPGKGQRPASKEGSKAGIERFWLAGEKGDIGVGLAS